MKTTDKDRRRFFRITDAIGVSYRQLASGEEGDSGEAHGTDLIRHYDQAISVGLAQVQQQDSAAGQVLELLNHKLNAILNLLEVDSLTTQRASMVNVEEASISACGIAFPVKQAIAADTHLAMSLYLKPGNHELQITGRVVDCAAIADNVFYLRVEFSEMNNEHREKLIQHIVQRQGSLLRSLREQLDG